MGLSQSSKGNGDVQKHTDGEKVKHSGCDGKGGVTQTSKGTLAYYAEAPYCRCQDDRDDIYLCIFHCTGMGDR